MARRDNDTSSSSNEQDAQYYAYDIEQQKKGGARPSYYPKEEGFLLNANYKKAKAFVLDMADAADREHKAGKPYVTILRVTTYPVASREEGERRERK